MHMRGTVQVDMKPGFYKLIKYFAKEIQINGPHAFRKAHIMLGSKFSIICHLKKHNLK
jgi:hypothetical protein